VKDYPVLGQAKQTRKIHTTDIETLRRTLQVVDSLVDIVDNI